MREDGDRSVYLLIDGRPRCGLFNSSADYSLSHYSCIFMDDFTDLTTRPLYASLSTAFFCGDCMLWLDLLVRISSSLALYPFVVHALQTLYPRALDTCLRRIRYVFPLLHVTLVNFISLLKQHRGLAVDYWKEFFSSHSTFQDQVCAQTPKQVDQVEGTRF